MDEYFISSSSSGNGTKNHGICICTLAWRCVEVLVDKDQSLLPCRTWGAVPVLVPPRFVSYFLKCSLLVSYKFFGEVEKTQPCFGFVCCKFTTQEILQPSTTCHLPGKKISEIRYCLRSLDAWASSVADTTWDATWDVSRRIWRWWRITNCWWSHGRALSKTGFGGGFCLKLTDPSWHLEAFHEIQILWILEIHPSLVACEECRFLCV